MTPRYELTKDTTADLIVGKRVRFVPPTPRAQDHLDVDVTAYINDVPMTGQHIIMGAEVTLGQRIEIGLPAGTIIELLDSVEPEPES